MKPSRLLCISLMLVIASAMLAAQSNPVALIYQPLTPATVRPGQSAFTLTVRGTGFVPGAQVNWNGTPLSTKVVSGRVLEAKVPAAAITKLSTASVTVANPGTIASNVIYFPIRHPGRLSFVLDPQPVEGGQIVIGDFNNDSKPDIAVQATDEDLDVYLNQGHGSLAQIPGPSWGGSSVLPAGGNLTGDFNGDGNLDISICSSNGGAASGCFIYLGDGAGGLTAGPGFDVVQGGGSVADMNGDGILDYVANSESSDGVSSALFVNLGNGDGTFQQGSPISVANNSGAPVIGDFNGDGKLDVAMPLPGSLIAVFLGKGDGTLRKEVDYPVTNAGSLAIADVNGDGVLDIITGGVSVLLGNGDGTFTAGSSLLLPNNNYGPPHLADMNGDGILDLVTTTTDSNDNQVVNILFGKGDGSFQNPITFTEGAAWRFPSLDVADINNDGRLDVILSGQPSFSVLLQVTPSK